jgi:hypothetical protein
MDVCHQLSELSILLTKNRFVQVLKKMSMARMPPVELHSIPCQEPAHDRSDRNGSGAQEQMHVVGHERPSVAGRSRLLKQARHPFKEILPILVILENPSSFDSSDDDMVQGTGRVNASLSWHAFLVPHLAPLINKETT